MLRVWLICVAAFVILPFKMETRTLSVYGFCMLALFIATFCIAGWLTAPPLEQRPRNLDVRPDFKLADRILKTAAMVALLAFAADLVGQGNYDLASAYAERSDRAEALLAGAASSSSAAFQFGFVTYPACYIYLVRHIGFEPRIRIHEVLLFGILPVLLGTFAMGGRAPLFYALLLVPFGLGLRRQYMGAAAAQLFQMPTGRGGLGLKILLGIGLLLAAQYFVSVFFIRAESAGGVEGMFDVAHLSWGISFDGYLSAPIRWLLGEEYTYLLFIFVWYLVQGLVMSNVLFTEYEGLPTYGVYGVDLLAALMRRVNGDFVADRFGGLLQLNTYGFLPSAFGSLYVDFAFFGLLFCAFWGWLSALVYKRVKQGDDPRWLLLAPFVTLGVFFSLINTPIGFSNGFVTYGWLVVTFVLTRKLVRVPDWQPARVPTPALA